MRPILVIILIYAVAFLSLTWSFRLLAVKFALYEWPIPVFMAGMVVAIVGAIVGMMPSILPSAFFATCQSSKNSFETHSWFASVNALLLVSSFCLPAGILTLINSDTLLLPRHSGSLIMSVVFPILLLFYSTNLIIQIIGDGTSGIRIYPNHIEIRKVGRYGWSFEKENISYISLIDDGSPVVVIHGKGERLDRLWSSILPDGSKARIEGSIFAGISVHEINEKLIEFGYGNKIRLQLKE